MARLDVKANFTAPAQVNIRLVRADVAEQANVFRVCFEASLALLSALVGAMLSLEKLERIHWVALAVLIVACVGFLWLTARVSTQMHSAAEGDDQ